MSNYGCAACGCALEGHANAGIGDRFSCPQCGVGDQLKTIVMEIAAADMKQALGDKFPGGTIAKGSGFAVTLTVPDSKIPRFIMLD